MKGLIRIGITGLLSLCLAATFAQELRRYHATRLEGASPVIDGALVDPAWDSGVWAGDFIQRQPYDGKAPSQETFFKILYNDEALFVAIKALDNEPEKIEKRLTRRDMEEGDQVCIQLDSYNDKLTSFGFLVSAAGVKSDFKVVNDDEPDHTWDPVWYVKVSDNAEGWYAEMKIPYSQLRFARQDEMTWGMELLRYIHRMDEISLWQPIPMDAPGWVGNYGELQGLRGIQPRKEVEIIPYAMGSVSTYEKEAGDPFSKGKEFNGNAGLDGKIAVTNDLTLNLTINPDFGQVEADPSVVNLSAFETFYQEKRPFFVEGNNIFSFKPTMGDGPMAMDNLFYSRRIGRSPQHCPELNDQEYMEMPGLTTILGAMKLSGKTRSGWSIGVMETLAQREQANIDMEGQQRKETVEPMTNYFNTRLQKDLNEGNTIIGGMITATNRKLSDSSICFLPGAAYTGGMDFKQFWKGRTYQLNISAVASHLRGSQEAIQEVQESPVHYFQRPDRDHARLDTSRTTLTGHGGTISFLKAGTGHWRYIAWLTWRSPGLDLNDMGYLRQADVIQQVIWASYRIWEPVGIFNSVNINFNQWTGWDFGGNYTYGGTNINTWTQFKNFMEFQTGAGWNTASVDRYSLRGGPAIRVPGAFNIWGGFETDNRKKFNAEFQASYYTRAHDDARMTNFGLSLTYQPLKSLQIVFGPEYLTGHDRLQYVTTVDESPSRYVMGRIEFQQLSANLRVNFSMTPDLSIQFWGQPFIFAGDFSEYKKAAETMAVEYEQRFHTYSPEEISFQEEDNIYHVAESGSEVEFSFDNPDFKVFEWRSNLVLRWEYLTGSSVYLVWSQGKMGDKSEGVPDFGNDMRDLFGIKAHNIFLVKMTYRISI